jgi:hypothetical protein
MNKSKKGATTPQSIKAAAKTVENVVNAAEASATRSYNVNKLGVRAEFNEFFRVASIKSSENDDYVLVTVVEGNKLVHNKMEVTTPYHVDKLRDAWFGKTYLNPGMTIADVDHSSLVNLQDLCATHLDEENVEEVDKDGNIVHYYMYGVSVLRYFVTEKPTDNWSAVNIVNDDNVVLEENVYLKKRLVRFDGSSVEEA